MIQLNKLTIKTAVANYCGAMENGDHFKNGASLKSQMSRGNLVTGKIVFLVFFILFGICTVESVQAQTFDCRRDKLDNTAIRFSPDPSSLTIGQRCDISIFNRNGRQVLSRDFNISSANTNVQSDGLSFFIKNDAQLDPWLYLDGSKLLEINGNITIAHNTCNHAYEFPYSIKQAFLFDNALNCQGEKRELAVARYKNTLNKNLYVVIDINQNQVHLLESPLLIDGSGVKGADGLNGSNGENGRSGLVIGGIGSRDGQNGTDGGDGGDGGNGGNGGEITVHVPQNISNQVSVNVDGGRAGQGGQGGKGGQGGRAATNGRSGRDGRDGRNGQYGQNGVKGNFTIVEDNEILKYFENTRHAYFKVEDIEL